MHKIYAKYANLHHTYTNSVLVVTELDKGEVQYVELRCHESVMDAVVDRFGIDVETISDENGFFKATVQVTVNNVFFGWIFGFDGAVSIAGPEDVLNQYRDMINRA